ncbi:hypothetical 18.1 kDa protein (plasmid) [Sinorhizobium fredii NGR234]|uniref:Uncharacterized protein y4lJ n=1 Tax=Sinorhizobium fredii (strain NBRC 101917 / NGR234) TaxID=394 RepID=Y4LJ_SINFN|nr:RecName: Full=Uncharacterized protein y4lJ [Sinorhizobium fredii NGR234]AAB91762.1 hypothetical 18.1 kDa protein [Sinorhizobium fredii NGR234]
MPLRRCRAWRGHSQPGTGSRSNEIPKHRNVVAFLDDFSHVVCRGPTEQRVIIAAVGKLVDRIAQTGKVAGDQVAVFVATERFKQVKPSDQAGLRDADGLEQAGKLAVDVLQLELLDWLTESINGGSDFCLIILKIGEVDPMALILAKFVDSASPLKPAVLIHRAPAF